MKRADTDIKMAGKSSGAASSPTGMISKSIGAARDRWHDIRARKTLRALDRLEDRLLKDVGLRREHLPNGATRVTRL